MSSAWWQIGWLWTTTGWSLVVVGAALLVWALFWDRAKGRRRCPKCWYDLSGAGAETGRDREGAISHNDVLCVCPECGRRIAAVRQMARTRRRWWGVASACVVLAAAYVAHNVPAYQNGGWVRAVPSTLLIGVAPTEFWTGSSAGGAAGALGGWMGATPPPLPAGTVGTAGTDSALSRMLGEEAWRRVQEDTMWAWQAAWFTRRAVEPERGVWEAQVAFPARWVAGVPMPVRITRTGGVGKWPVELAGEAVTGTRFTHNTSVYPVETPKAPGTVFAPPIRFMIKARTVYAAASTRTCVLVASAAEILGSDTSAETGELARTFVHPRLVVDEYGTLCLLANNRSSHPAWARVRTGLGCRIEILLDGAVAGTADFAPAWGEPEEWFTTELGVRWATGMRARVARDPCAARIRMTGDADLSYRAYCVWPFDDEQPTCWTGSIEFDAPVVTGEADVGVQLRGTRRLEGR